MTSLKIADLTIHPKNDYYFDDVTGEKWERLIDSIKNNGVRTPIIVTDNMVVVSGNQRVRACKELGISVINAEIEHYKSEDDVIRDLIEINIRQRGVIDDSEIKAGRRFEFLQRYYGVQHGNNQHSTPNNSESSKTQEQIAEESGISVDTMQNCIKLSQMIPEMQDLLDTGIVKPTTALAIIKQLPEEQQKELAEKFMEGGKKVPKSKAEEEIQRIKSELAEKDEQIKNLETEGKEREDYITELENREPEVKTVEVIKEVVPEDIKRKAEMADIHEKDFKTMQKAYEEMAEKYKQSEAERQKMIDEANKPEVERAEKIRTSALMFCAGVSNFIEKYGGYVWLTESINEMRDSERKGYLSAINAIESWVSAIKGNMEGIE